MKPSWEAADEYVGTWQLWNFISRFQGGRERKRKSRWQQNESVYMWNQSSAQRAFPVTLFHNIICCLFGCWVFKNLISKNNSKVFQEEQRIKSGASHKRLTSLSSLAFSPLSQTAGWCVRALLVPGSRQGAAAAGEHGRLRTRAWHRLLPPPQPCFFPTGTCSAQSNPPKDSINPKKGVTDRGILRFLPRHPPLGWRSAWYSNQSQIADWTQGMKLNTSNLDF